MEKSVELTLEEKIMNTTVWVHGFEKDFCTWDCKGCFYLNVSSYVKCCNKIFILKQCITIFKRDPKKANT